MRFYASRQHPPLDPATGREATLKAA